MRAIESPHRLPDDVPRRGPSSAEIDAAFKLEVRQRLGVVESRLPWRGTERWMLGVLIALAALTLGTAAGILYELHRLLEVMHP